MLIYSGLARFAINPSHVSHSLKKKNPKSPVTSLAMTHARRSFRSLSMKFHGLFGNKSTCDAKQHCHAPFKMKKKVHTNEKWNQKAPDTRRLVHESEVKGKHRDNSGAFRLNNNIIREKYLQP